jgi:DNA-binding response OmpR family regulator
MQVSTNEHSLEVRALDVSGIQLDPATRQVYIDGELVPRRLSRKEFRLLELLASDPGRIFRREETVWAIYGEKYMPRFDDERLDAMVERTRRRIGDSSRVSRFLETLRGRGHRLKEYSGLRLPH